MTQPKRKFIYYLVFLFSFFFFNFIGCKKVDRLDDFLDSQNSIENIRPSPDSDSSFKRVAKFLMVKDQKQAFLKKLIKKQGRPIWKGALAMKIGNSLIRGVSSESDTIVVIPLVLDSTNYVMLW